MMGVSAVKTFARAIVGRGGQSQALSWGTPRVAALCLLGLGQYADAFLENGVDGALLLTLSKDQLERCLHIDDPMHRYSLEVGIYDLKNKQIDYDSWEWTADGVLEWLHKRGLGMLMPTFRQAAVHGGVLFRLQARKGDAGAFHQLTRFRSNPYKSLHRH